MVSPPPKRLPFTLLIATDISREAKSTQINVTIYWKAATKSCDSHDDSMKNRIAQIRQLKGMSLTEVAAAASTTKAQIQKLEKGERRLTLDWMERIARALGVSVVDLIPSGEAKSGAQKVDVQIMSMVNMLSEKDKRMLLDVAEGLFSRNAKR